MPTRTRPRILCVDDEPNVLAGLKVTLRKRFEVVTAESGAAGLRALAEKGPFAVVLSDYRMPEMDGAAFLARAKGLAPGAVRMLLTGHASVEAAMSAVNEGHIFRLLLKPCPPDVLLPALEDALEQARLATADRELVQQKLDAVAAQLLHAERLATIGTLAGAVGNEINGMATVLQVAIHGLSEDAAAGRPPDAAQLAALRQAQEHLASHGRHLLQLGRPRPAAGGRSDLARAAAGTVDLMRAAGLLRRAQIRLDVPATPVPVDLEATRAEQVVLNLLRNALEAVAGAAGRAPTVTVKVAADAAARIATCTVIDDGRGIARDALPLVFEPYYTTKAPGEGTGLGLFAVREIVTAAGGQVTAESEAGEGSTFTVRLPLADAAA